MDPLDFLEPEELLQFFHCRKTEISCMENPHTFLSQLRDHNLIPEDRYKKVSRMKSKENMKKALYEILDWVEREQSQHIQVFWKCVFREAIMSNYPTLQMLYKSLMDGSFQFDSQLPERVEMKDGDKSEGKELSEGEEKQTSSVKKKRKRRSKSMCEEEQPGPSSQLTPAQRKKPKKICYSSPLKKGENSDFWNWPIYKIQLPVTCGKCEGSLKRDKLAKGERCIWAEKQWFTPPEFEKFAGKESNKNWKWSIRCMGTPLSKLIKEGHLKSTNFKRRTKEAKKSLFPTVHLTDSEGEKDDDEEGNQEDEEGQSSSSNKESSTEVTDEEEETEEQTEQPLEGNHDGGKKVFKVSCGAVTGTLHKKRFGSGTCGKCIRTETSWMSPVDFVKAASCQTDVSWRKDIKWEGKPLNALIEAKLLRIHSLLCTCRLCKPEPHDLDNEKNDDECCICKSEEEEKLVVCDHCPRSFHQKCHLPHVEDTTLGDDRPWMCTFCVYDQFQGWSYSDEVEKEAVMSYQISRHMLQCQYLVLYLCSADEEQIFTTNPSLYLENYSSFVKTPMWLGNVADKLQRKQYQTVDQFVSDVQLIFTNCAIYNKNNAEFLAMGDKLKQLFDEEFKKAFNILE